MNRILLSLALLMLSCSNNEEWRSSPEDFETKKLTVSKGKHVLIAIADKPVTCALYRNGEVLKDMQYDGNICSITFDSTQSESLIFVIRYELKDSKERINFKYHATLI